MVRQALRPRATLEETTYELTQYELYGVAYAELIEHLRSSSDLELRVPVPVLARYLAAVTDGLTRRP